jgi:lactate dehydrogenase-like 2-hydroxyacid dehydrogenase
MAKPIVVLTRRWPEAAERRLGELFDVRCNERDEPMGAEELREALQRADAVCPTISDALPAEVLDVPGRRARILANFGVGFNHIDIEAARRIGLVVTNTPDVLTDCTADVAMMLVLMVARRAGEGERQLRRGEWCGWAPTSLLGRKVSGKTLGLVGFGRIGRAVARRARLGFGMQVLFFDPSPAPEEVVQELGARRCATLEELLAAADFVSLHCPGGAANRHLIDARRLDLLRPDAYLINTARGDVVDQQALYHALVSGRLAGAGFDVYEDEPRVPEALCALENVVLLPHLGSATVETRTAMGFQVAENLEAFFSGREPRDRVV